jgi:ribonuclease HII
MLVVGIDENGLGPLLGPMVVTAAAFETDVYDADKFWQVCGAGLAADDSKKIFSSKKLATAEAATLDWLDLLGVNVPTTLELIERLSLPLSCKLPCGRNMPGYCRPIERRLPIWATETEPIGRKRERFLEAGFAPYAVRSFSVCTGAYNVLTQGSGINKFHLDFNLMIQLIKTFKAGYSGDVVALCGKVGGTRKYGAWIDEANVGLWSILDENPALSTYRISGLGTVSFIRDGDGTHLPIAVASMVGKYVREVAMLDLNEYLGDSSIRRASGYRDPVTKEFVRATKDRRAGLGMPDECFIRTS